MKIGFIDYYLDEWHANNYPKMLKESSDGEIQVAYAYGQIASPISGKTSKEWCQEYGVTLCETIEEVVEKSDGLIVLSPDHCEKHEELSRLALMSGKRTYIDKTFSPDKKGAVAMFSLGEAYHTPCYSTSALRFAAEYEPYIGQHVKSMSMWGPSLLEVYGIHQIEPLMMLMKGNIKRAIALKEERWVNLLLEWEDGRNASVLCTGVYTPFAATLQLDTGCKVLNIQPGYFTGFVKELVEFFRTGIIPVSHEETISIMVARELMIKAAEHPGNWVYAE